jgi:hypothetical protein
MCTASSRLDASSLFGYLGRFCSLSLVFSSAQLIINELYHAFISAPVLYTSNGSKAKHNNLLSETLHQLTSTSFSFAFEETLLFLSDMCLRRVLCIILNSDEIYLGGPFCATFILQIDLEGSQAM